QPPIGFEHLEKPPVQGNDYTTTPIDNGESKERIFNSLFFDDQIRRIDFVLAFTSDQDETRDENRRACFEDSLKKFGLELECTQKLFHKKTVHFIKIHAPWDVLCVYAEFLHMKMPLAKNDLTAPTSCLDRLFRPFQLDPTIVQEDENYFTAPFSTERLKQS
ncbi:hypothetical protein Ahia01_000822500, partial [Argonauta hians]